MGRKAREAKRPISPPDSWKAEFARLNMLIQAHINSGRQALAVPRDYLFEARTGDFIPPREEASG